MALDLRARIESMSGNGNRWPGFEQLTGWAILALPFSTGDILGVRDFPFSDFAPYHSVWHRDPAGDWSVYVDGPSLEIGCPRWWGPGLRTARLATISIDWTGPRSVRIAMAEPALEWSVAFSERATEALMNRMGGLMPPATWRPRSLRAMRELMAHRVLDLGRIQLDGPLPTGNQAVLMPDLVYGVESSEAVLRGVDLGPATRAPSEPRVGDFPFPVRGALAIGDFRARIADEQEHRALAERYREYRAPAK
jgi:hypothetical protein